MSEFNEIDKKTPSTDQNDFENKNKILYMALDCLVHVVGLTAFKYESQRDTLQEAIDIAKKALIENNRNHTAY